MIPEITTAREPLEIAAALILWGGATIVVVLRARSEDTENHKRIPGAILRLLFATSLLSLFLAPQTTQTIERRPPIAIVVDDSASMTRALGTSDAVRDQAEAIAKVIRGARGEGRRECSARFLSGAPEFSRTTRSDLASVADRLAPEESNAVVALITDGIPNPPELPDATKRRAVVYPVVVGTAAPALNWRLGDPKIVPSTDQNGKISVEAPLSLLGTNEPRSAVVKLWRRVGDDAPPSLVESKEVQAPESDENGSRQTTIQFAPASDENDPSTFLILVADQDDAERADSPAAFLPDATISGATRPKETCLADNAASFSPRRGGDKIRVLLVDDLPRYEYRYLRETLRREPTVELKTLLLSADLETTRSDPLATPRKKLARGTLAEFDVVIVGNLTREQWAETLARLPEVVERDDSTTSVWFAGDSAFSEDPEWRTRPEARLAPGVPVASEPDAENDLWKPSAASATGSVWNDWNPEDAPELTRIVAGLKPDATAATLLYAQNETTGTRVPLFAAKSLGKNAVLWQSTDEAWRLQTLSDKSVYRTFVLRTLDYLTIPELRASTRESTSDAPSATESDASDPFDYFSPNNARRLLELRELENVAASMEYAEAIAQATGGEALDLRDVSEEASLSRARQFRERLFQSGRAETTVVKEPLTPVSLNFSLAVLLFLLLFLL